MTQPINSGAPTPVQGVTGGPPVLGGQIGSDPVSGNVVINPNPGNAVQLKKSPSAFDVFEYFNSNTDYSRLSMTTALGGPDQVGIVSQPPSVTRDLQILASGNGHVTIPALLFPSPQFQFIQQSANVSIPAGNVPTYLQMAFTTQTGGRYLCVWMVGFANGVATPNDYQTFVGNASFVAYAGRSHASMPASGTYQDVGFTVITADASGSINLNSQANSACNTLSGFTAFLAWRIG